MPKNASLMSKISKGVIKTGSGKESLTRQAKFPALVEILC